MPRPARSSPSRWGSARAARNKLRHPERLLAFTTQSFRLGLATPRGIRPSGLPLAAAPTPPGRPAAARRAAQDRRSSALRGHAGAPRAVPAAAWPRLCAGPPRGSRPSSCGHSGSSRAIAAHSRGSRIAWAAALPDFVRGRLIVRLA